MACFPSEPAFVAWLRSADSAQMLPCHDCTQSYQAQMLRAGRCEHPEVRFSARGTALGLSCNEHDAAESAFLVQVARRMFGVPTAASVAGVAAGSLAQYANQTRILPERKRARLKRAICCAAKILVTR